MVSNVFWADENEFTEIILSQTGQGGMGSAGGELRRRDDANRQSGARQSEIYSSGNGSYHIATER